MKLYARDDLLLNGCCAESEDKRCVLLVLECIINNNLDLMSGYAFEQLYKYKPIRKKKKIQTKYSKISILDKM